MAEDSASSGVVENLVTQFSNALDCFRELVQNSLDSGTTRVEVWAEFEAGEGHEGVIAFHVDDFGEGMDEAIIDDQLTNLFSSSKEDDLTKIGKFGIGFVSVFALEPKAVLVNTGRGGEWWEVLFHVDRSFDKSRLEVPVEGTQITIFLEGDYHRYRELVDGVRATLKRWCAHSETEITFEDRSPAGGGFGELEVINEEFLVDGDCSTRVEVPGTEIVLAYTPAPIYGFYNRGLTLALTEIGDQVFDERRSARYRRVSVKIKSRYLEHTLSRETVMRDENYEKAMALLDGGADGQLLGKLTAELRELVGRDAWGLVEMDRYATLSSYLMSEPEQNLVRLLEEPILRGVFGEPVTPRQAFDAFRADGRVMLSEQPTELARGVIEQGVPVILGRAPEGGGVEADAAAHPLDAVYRVVSRFVVLRRERSLTGRLRSLLFGHDLAAAVWRGMVAPEQVYLYVSLDPQTPKDLRGLLDEAARLLKHIGAGYQRLRTFTDAGASSRAPFFVTGRKLSSLMSLPPPGGVKSGKLEAAVNRDHLHFQTIARLSGQSPALAAYCLAKSLLLTEDRLLDRDVNMMEAALGGR